MVGKLILFTENPVAIITLNHDNGQSFSATAVDGTAELDFDLPDGNGATLIIDGKSFRGVLWTSLKNPVNGSSSFAIDTFPSFNKRVAPKSHTPLPPFDKSDQFGIVHTVLPPEQVIPNSPDINWWRGDIAGVMLEETPPFVPGANTTPPEMVMSFLLEKYDRTWQDKILTAHAERGYTHFHLGRNSPVELFAYVQSWGFFTSYWATDRTSGTNWSDLLTALINNNLAEKTIIAIGGELNSFMSPEALQTTIDQVSRVMHDAGGKTALHFTSNVPSWQAGMTPYEWWTLQAGKVDFLLWQGDSNNSAGEMGARLWDARVRVANNARTVAFELLASNQLYGKASEEYGCLRGWEMICCTRNPPNSPIRAVSGFGNGARFPDGRPI